MNNNRINTIRASAAEIAAREKNSPLDAITKEDADSWAKREMQDAATSEEFLWLDQDVCARIYVYSLLRAIDIKTLEKIDCIFREEDKNIQRPVDINEYIGIDPLRLEDEDKLRKRLPEDFIVTNDPIAPVNNSLYRHSSTVFLGLRSLEDDLLQTLDSLPVAWSYKREFLLNLYQFYQNSLEITKRRPTDITNNNLFSYTQPNQAPKYRRDLNTFSRIEPNDIEEIQWAAIYFRTHLIDIYSGYQRSVQYAYSEAIASAQPSTKAYQALCTMLLLWTGGTSDRMLFDTKFSGALSQRRHRAKRKERVPLNTHISPKSRSHLRELAKKKQKTQYEVLEELIYKEHELMK